MDEGVVVDAGVRDAKKLTNSLGRLVGQHLELERPQVCLDNRAIATELRRTVLHEWLGRRIANRDRLDVDARARPAVGARLDRRDLLDDLEAIHDASEHRVLAVERWLVGHRHKELRAGAVGSRRIGHGGDGTRGVFLGVRLPAHLIQPALSPIRHSSRIARERIAPLNHGVLDDAVKRGAGKPAVTRDLHEQPDVIRRRVREQLEDERAERGLDDRLFAPHVLERIGRLERAPGHRETPRSRRASATSMNRRMARIVDSSS